MILNFGHTFAHAIEVKNNYSKKISHGEAVLSGMILVTRLSFIKNVCSKNTLRKIEEIYEKNNLKYTFEKYRNYKLINSLIPFLKNDKKNDDDRINFILLKKLEKQLHLENLKFNTQFKKSNQNYFSMLISNACSLYSKSFLKFS